MIFKGRTSLEMVFSLEIMKVMTGDFIIANTINFFHKGPSNLAAKD